MSLTRPLAALACLLFLALAAIGCGGSGGSDTSVTSSAAPSASDFPSAKGKTLGDVLNNCYGDGKACGPATVAVSPASQVFYKGPNRYSFGVFHFDRSPINDAKVALYFAPVPKQPPGKTGPNVGAEADEDAAAEALDQPAQGPFPARVDSLTTDPAFRSETSAQDPNAATSVYTTTVNFPKNGEWRIAAVIKDGDKYTASLLPSAIVGEFKGIPRVGERPPRINTPTVDSVGGDRSKLTTRVPPEQMNDVNFADVLGKDPIVLIFATPQFCQSRVCGPVVDIAEQVREESPDDVKFIHMEIYNNNQPNDGFRPQVRAFNLPSEPWVFVIDRNGIITTEIEGAFSADELQRAVDEVSG